jgi:hypothetical protein
MKGIFVIIIVNKRKVLEEENGSKGIVSYQREG